MMACNHTLIISLCVLTMIIHNVKVIAAYQLDDAINDDRLTQTDPTATIATLTSTSSTNQTSSCSITLTEFVLYFYFQPIICFIGFILNLVNVAVFRKPQFTGAAYAYMTAMSLADAVTLLSYMPSGLVRCAGYFPYCQHTAFKRFRAGMMYYNTYVLFPLGNMSEATSVWFTVLLSIERYMAMRQLGISFRRRKSDFCSSDSVTVSNGRGDVSKTNDTNATRHPNAFQKLRTSCRQLGCRWKRKITPVAWNPCCRMSYCRRINYQHCLLSVTVFSICLNFPLFFVQTVKEKYSNKTSTPKLYTSLTIFGDSDFYRAFSWMRTLLIQGIPLVFLCIANFCLFHFIQLAGSRRKILMQRQQQQQQQQQQCHHNRQRAHDSVIQREPSILKLQPLPDQTERKKKHKASSHRNNLRNPATNGGSSSRWHSAQRKLTILLVVIVALFLAGQIPQALAYVTIFEVFSGGCERWSCCHSYPIYRAVTQTLCLFTYAVNFFVYLMLNKHFKNQLSNWIHTMCPSCPTNRSILPYRTQITTTMSQIPRKRRDSSQNHSPPTSRGSTCLQIPECGRQKKKKRREMEYTYPVVMDLASEPVSAPNRLISADSMHQTSTDEPMSFTNTYQLHPISGTQEQVGFNVPKAACLRHTQSAHAVSSFCQHCFPRAYQPVQRAISHQTTVPLQLGNCFTETHHELPPRGDVYVTHSCKTYVSPDSLVRKLILQSSRPGKLNTMRPTSSESSNIGQQPRDESEILPRTNHHDPMSIMPVSTAINSLNQISHNLTSYPYISTDSGMSYPTTYPPIVYQESDFDVISVDDSGEYPHHNSQTAV